jgi:general secretion pathway protein G
MTNRARSARAFSLVELMIVISIIGLLVALVAPRLAGALGRGRVQSTRAQIELLSGGVTQFNLDVGRYPTTEEGLGALLTRPQGVEADVWKGPYLEKDFVPTDAWGRAFQYENPDTGRFVIRSLGADGQPGGEGDNADLDNRSE